MAKLMCPHCGEERLWSEEKTTIMYPAVFRKVEDGTIGPDYTGDRYDVIDEGTEYDGTIWCRSCGRRLTEEELVPAGVFDEED